MEAGFTDRVTQAAARWYARLQAADCTPEERAECARWQALDQAHAAAYAAAERLALSLRRAAATNTRLAAMTHSAFAESQSACSETARSAHRAARSRRRAAAWKASAALAASVTVAALGAVGYALQRGTDAPVAPAAAETASGRRTLALDDGTMVELDVQSRISWRITPSTREVALLQGRAIFDVAHDSRRPFTVSAGANRVSALGTVFQVARSESAVVITLAEGAVAVTGESRGPNHTERLRPGEELRIAASGSSWRKRPVDAHAAMSWSIGRHVFRDVRLGEAITEINRYAAVKVRVADRALAELTVSGNFVAGDSRVIAAAFAAVLPLEIVDGGDELVLQTRPAEHDTQRPQSR